MNLRGTIGQHLLSEICRAARPARAENVTDRTGMGDVAIFGAGGLGQLVHDILVQAACDRPVAFLDSDPRLAGGHVVGLPVLGGTEMIASLARRGIGSIIIAIGASRTRAMLAQRCETVGLRLVSAIHPLASIAASARLAQHLVLGARCTLCVHAQVGAHSVLSTGAIVEHDNRLGEGVFLHPAVRLAGGVQVGDFATIGIGSSVIPGRRIGPGAYVAPGSVVIRDVAAHALVGGVPAQLLEQPASGFSTPRARRDPLWPRRERLPAHGDVAQMPPAITS